MVFDAVLITTSVPAVDDTLQSTVPPPPAADAVIVLPLNPNDTPLELLNTTLASAADAEPADMSISPPPAA